MTCNNTLIDCGVWLNNSFISDVLLNTKHVRDDLKTELTKGDVRII